MYSCFRLDFCVSKTLLMVTFLLFLQLFPKNTAVVSKGKTYNVGNAPIPKFTTPRRTFQVVNGDTVELPCDVANLGTFVLVWRRGSTLLSAGHQLITRDPRFSLIGYNLQLIDVGDADQGEYTCQLGDGSSGDLIHSVEILMPPTVQMIPNNGQVIIRKGGSTTFECRVTGNPLPTVTWSKKDGLLPSGMQRTLGYSLSLVDIQRDDSGVYQCIATNGIGQPLMADVKLHVLYSPEVTLARSWINLGDGLEAKLDCIVHADPPAKVFWYQDSFVLEPTDRRLMSANGNINTLTLKNIQLSDFGNYSCVVINSIGKNKKFVQLSGRPGPPSITSSGYSGRHHYKLTWTVQSVFPITEVKILFRRLIVNNTYQNPENWHDLVVYPKELNYNSVTSERSQFYQLNNLIPDSVYECLLQAKNHHGYGDLSDLHQWFTSQKGKSFINSNSSIRLKTSIAEAVAIVIFLQYTSSLTS